MDLMEAEDIKKRWQEYREELYKKERSIIMNKASGGDGIPFELLQILKDDVVKLCTQYASKFGDSAVATGLEKVSFHSNAKERQCQRMLTLPHNCTHLTC